MENSRENGHIKMDMKNKVDNISDAASYAGHRPLAAFEEVMDTMHEIGNYMFVVCTFLKSRFQLQDHHVKQVLCELQRRHPLFRMCIGRHGNERYFRDMDDLYLDFEVLDHDDWEETYENMLCTRFNTERGPLWRSKMLLMPTLNTERLRDPDETHVFCYTVLFSFHHAIADGICCAYTIKQFIELLGEICNNDTLAKIDEYKRKSIENLTEAPEKETRPKTESKQLNFDTKPLELLPSLESLLPQSDVNFGCLGVLTLLQLLVKQIRKKKSPYLKRFPPILMDREITEIKTKVIPFKLTKDETQLLLAKCKEEKVSVHGVLTAAANIAMATIIQSKGSVSLRSIHPIDARRIIKPVISSENCGNLVLSINMNFKVPIYSLDETPNKLFKHARHVTRMTGRALYMKEHTSLLRVFDKVWNRDNYIQTVSNMQKTGARDGDHSFTLSNLGNLDKILKYDDEDDRDIKVDNIIMATGIHKFGPVYLHNIVTFKKQLHWHLNYTTSITTAEQALEYSHMIHKTILSILK